MRPKPPMDTDKHRWEGKEGTLNVQYSEVLEKLTARNAGRRCLGCNQSLCVMGVDAQVAMIDATLSEGVSGSGLHGSH